MVRARVRVRVGLRVRVRASLFQRPCLRGREGIFRSKAFF
jgi:hypothetical protein